MKQCIKCGEVKAEGEFERGKNQCKACRQERSRAYRNNNLEKCRRQSRVCSAKGRESCSDWYIAHLLAQNTALMKADMPQVLIEAKRALIQIGRIERENSRAS